MNNDDRYLSKPTKKLPRKVRLTDDDAPLNLTIGSGAFVMGAGIFTLIGVGAIADPAIEMWVLAGCFTALALVSLYMGFSDVSFAPEVPEKEFGHDPQARGLYDRIRAVTEHSTAGWDDDLWQAFFTIGKLIDEKKNLSSVTLAQELHDEIEALVAELDEMLTARKALIDERRRLGMSLQVPGTEAQRLEAGAVEEMEELAMRPLLRQRVDQIKLGTGRGG